MKRFGLLFGIIAAGFFVFQSCSKSKDDCAFLAPQMVFVGFDEADSDTLIIRRFTANGLFNQQIDSILIPEAAMTRTVVGQDSIVFVHNYTPIDREFYGYNWEMYLPGVNKTVRISDIIPRFTQEEEASAQCRSYAASVNFDNRNYIFSTWFDVAYRVYAKK